MLKNLELLFTEIENEVKEQTVKREEYKNMIAFLIDKFIREETKIDRTIKWKLNFRWYSSKASYRKQIVTFSQGIIYRSDVEGNITKNDITSRERENIEMDDAINYMINNDNIESFIEYLSIKAIPLFMQNQSIPSFEFYGK